MVSQHLRPYSLKFQKSNQLLAYVQIRFYQLTTLQAGCLFPLWLLWLESLRCSSMHRRYREHLWQQVQPFRQLDQLLPSRVKKLDGILVEPKYYVPIIPMVLVNGMTGIGTGFSTNIPQHNPLDLIESIQGKLNGKDFLNIQPWFRGFKGTIFKRDEKTFVSKGVYKVINPSVIEISELPNILSLPSLYI